MSSGPRALSSVCLRCQLHAAIIQTGPLRTAPKHIAQRCNAFSTHRPRLQEVGQLPARDQNRNNGGGRFMWKRIALSNADRDKDKNGIVILEDPPKQKANARLRANDQHTDGSAMEDRPAPKDAAVSPSSAEQIETAASELPSVPAEADVNASLDALRLEITESGTVVEAKVFEKHLIVLAKSYIVHQLNRYLIRSVRSSSDQKNRYSERHIPHGFNEIQTSQWCPGRTPIERRPVKTVRRRGPGRKLNIADRILRLAWDITVESEENLDGELEMKLSPWQLSLLFDLSSDSMRYLDGIVEPKTLLQSAVVESYRPDSVLRITGRYHTAQEIARQLEIALLRVNRLGWDLKPLVPSIRTSGVMSTAIFRDEDIRYVAQLTESVIIPETDGVLAIYCMQRPGMYNARRLLLALLDDPRLSFDGVASTIDNAAVTTFDSPVGNSQVGVFRRYHGLKFFRTIEPLGGRNDSDEVRLAQIDEAATSLAHQLDSVKPTRHIVTSANHSSSYWREAELGDSGVWTAEFCTLLNPKDREQMCASVPASSTPPLNIVQHMVPGLETLLSHFEAPRSPETPEVTSIAPDSNHGTTTYIVAHLKPSTHFGTSDVALPRLELRFSFSAPKAHSEARELILTGVRVVIDEQRLSVPLPGHATDLQFTRQSRLYAKVRAAIADPNILSFVRKLQSSARGKGALAAHMELQVKLPPSLAGLERSETSTGDEDVTVKYLFERFEHIEELEFTASQDGERTRDMDAEVKSTLADLPSHLRLKYREIEGGAIYGNSTVLALCLGRGLSAGGKEVPIKAEAAVEQRSEENDLKSASSSSLSLASAALRIVHLLTRANTGTLQPFGQKAEE